ADQHARALFEGWARIFWRRNRAALGLAFVLTEFCGCQPVVSVPGFLIAKQRGNRESPLTAGTGPAHVGVALHPNQRAWHDCAPCPIAKESPVVFSRQSPSYIFSLFGQLHEWRLDILT